MVAHTSAIALVMRSAHRSYAKICVALISGQAILDASTRRKEHAMLIYRKFNREKFLGDNPTLIGVVAGIKFYEHPKKGDESPLIADTGTEIGLTDFWELPEITDLYEIDND